MSNNFTYVIPVSGFLFPQQLSAMCYLFEKLKTLKIIRSPRLVCSSSGGNVSAYIAMGSGWEKSNIINTVSTFKSDIFVKSWAPFVPSILLFPLTKTFFRKSDDPENYIIKRFNKSSITETEIWSGCFNDSEDKNELFCNLSYSDSILKNININLLKETYTNPPNYLDGNIEIIAKTVYASAALPYITEQVDIHDNKYIDGGLMYASPFSCLYPAIKSYYTSSSNKYQVFYFSPVLVSVKPSSLVNIEIISLLLHGSLINDKNYAIAGLGVNYSHERYENLEFLTSTFIQDKNFVVILSPSTCKTIDLINVDPNKIIDIINKPAFICDVYYN